MLVMSLLNSVLLLMFIKYANSAPQAVTVTLRPPAITVTLQPIPTVPPREAKPLPFYSTTQQPFAKPLPFYSTTQQPFAKPLPFYSTSATLVFHDDHNTLRTRGRRSVLGIKSVQSNASNTVKLNNEIATNNTVPTAVPLKAVSRVATTESFRDMVQVF